MATQVGRSLSEIDNKVRQLAVSIKESTKKTKELDRTLKLDPRNTQVVGQQMRALGTQIGQATQQVVLLRQRQAEANRELQQGNITAAEFKKIEQSVQAAELQLQRFNAQFKNVQRAQVDRLAGQFDKVTRSMQRAQRVAQTFSRMALGLVAVVAGAITAFTRHATTLADMADAYEMCIERLQRKRNIFAEVTGSADNFNRSLDRLNSRLNRITLGTGIAYENILNHIGVASRDAEGRTRSLSDIYDEVIERLREMEDIQLRNRLAYELFGEEAIYIIEILEMCIEEYERLKYAQYQANIISEEQAERAREVQAAWEAVRDEFIMTGAELATSLLPLIQTLAELIQNFLLPILTSLAQWFANMHPVQQWFTLFILFLVMFLPKFIVIGKGVVAIIKKIAIAKKKAAVGAKMLSVASTPLQPILLAVAAVILILATLFAFLTGRSRELSSTMDRQTGSLNRLGNAYGDLGANVAHNTNQVSQNHNRTTQDVNVTIDARGETPISQENAELVADILAERINKELGGKI